MLFLEPSRDSSAKLPAVIEVARDQIAELGVRLRVAPRPRDARLSITTAHAQAIARETSAIAVVWLDRQDQTTTIYFYEPRAPRLLTRRVAVSQSQAAAAEEVALILRSALSAVLEGDEVAMTEIEVPKPEAKLVTEPSPEKVMPLPSSDSVFSALALGFGYAGTRVSSGGAWQNGARLFAEFSPAPTGGVVGLAYGIFPMLTFESELAKTHVSRHPSELIVGYVIGPGNLQILPEIRLMGDYLWRTTERADPRLEKSEPSGRFVWSVSGNARVRFAISTRLRVFSSVGADFLLNHFDQVAMLETEQSIVFSPLRVRPQIEAGFSVDIF